MSHGELTSWSNYSFKYRNILMSYANGGKLATLVFNQGLPVLLNNGEVKE